MLDGALMSDWAFPHFRYTPAGKFVPGLPVASGGVVFSYTTAPDSIRAGPACRRIWTVCIRCSNIRGAVGAANIWQVTLSTANDKAERTTDIIVGDMQVSV